MVFSPRYRWAQSTDIPLLAPIVWLDVKEQYFPSDIYAQVVNTDPMVNFTAIDVNQSPLTLENLDILNLFGDHGANVYLTSIMDVTTDPKWLDGVVPDTSGKTNNATSCAIIISDHGAGMVDVFYFYFYAYNQGNTVLFHELGDHIGDWEHNMIRFQDGLPQLIWYSQHGNGEAYVFEAVEKEGTRPISYAARGSHAMYSTPGTHDHTIPNLNLPRGFIQDYTSRGTRWDPIKNTYSYNFNSETSSFRSADGESPVGMMYFKGLWGDKQYAADDPRQEEFFSFYKYTGGPTGPWNKQLNRTKVCPENGLRCIIRGSLRP